MDEADAADYDPRMSKAKQFPPAGTASGGVCRPDPQLWTLPEMELRASCMSVSSLNLECDDGLRSRDEQRFFDWCIGILEDAGVVGVIRNDYVYQASVLHAEIHSEFGRPYFLMLTRTSVEFDIAETKDAPLLFEPAIFETDGDVLEANELRSAFNMIRRQAAVLRAWKDSTSLASNQNVAFKHFQMPSGDFEVALDIEAPLAGFTIVVRRLPTPGTFNYSLSGVESPLMYSPRVVDALLSDAAEEAGTVPDPATLVTAMIATAWLARRDPEWQAGSAASQSRRG